MNEPTDTIAIRLAAEADLDAATDIYAQAVRHGTASYELEPPSRTEMAARFAALRDSGYPYFVAEDEGGIIGFAYAGPFRPRPAYRFIAEDSIYIAPGHQGRGVGRLLLQELIRACGELGFRQIIAVIGDGSPQSTSVRLHEAMGFRHCGTLEGTGYKHGRWLDTVLMQLALNGGSTLPPDPGSLPERNFRKRL
ncbi:MAG TPA: GNAT family N-acetyltransferase [Rhizobiaceae bacterium]|nr:GNAT family N-acetyltransferase [Rhizobiaceae bacterium]